MKKTNIFTWVFSPLLILGFTVQAQARSEYVPTVQAQLGTSAVSCSACHSGSPSEGNAVLPLANTFRTGAELGQSDSDHDGFTNKQEVGSGLSFNTAAVTPFTVASSGIRLTNVYVVGDASATEQAFAAADGGLTVPANSHILGNISVDIYTAPVTLTFKAGGAAATSTLFMVDTYAQTNTPLAATDWSVTTTGAVTINALPAGAPVPATIVVQRVIPIPPAPGSGGYSVGEEEHCMTNGASTMLLMTLALLTLGALSRRK